VLLALWVTPGAARSEVGEVSDGRLRLRVAAPAHDDRANREACRYLARRLGVAPGRVGIAGGGSARRKTVRIADIDVASVRAGLGL